MERKIGETFEFEGKKLKVMKDEKGSCDGCFFDNEDDCCIRNPTAGTCNGYTRTDKEPVIFVEAKDEQLQEQAEQQKLNLCEILKDCPKGWEFYSSIYGKLRFDHININSICPIVLRKNKDFYPIVTKYGRHSADYENEGECTLFPSKDQRDWSKFTAPWYKKEKFDPKNLQPFDKVLAKDSSTSLWKIELFSHMIKSRVFSCVCMHTNFMYCIPYNDDTKHLLGTTDEAPEFYKYWED